MTPTLLTNKSLEDKMRTLDVTIVVADVPNKNKRVYPMSTCLALVEQANKKKKWPGTMNRPIGRASDADIKALTSVRVKDVSHQISNFRMEGSELKATVTIVNTPAGHVLNNMIEAEIEMAFRIFGEVKLRLCEKNDSRMIVDQCKMIEVVAMPAELAA